MLRNKFGAAMLSLVVAVGMPCTALAAEINASDVPAKVPAVSVETVTSVTENTGAETLVPSAAKDEAVTDGESQTSQEATKADSAVTDESSAQDSSDAEVTGDKPLAESTEDKGEGEEATVGGDSDSVTVVPEGDAAADKSDVTEEIDPEFSVTPEEKPEGSTEEPGAVEIPTGEIVDPEFSVDAEIPTEEIPTVEVPVEQLPVEVVPVEEIPVVEPIPVEATLTLIHHGKYEDVENTIEEKVEGYKVGDTVDLTQYISNMLTVDYIVYSGDFHEITIADENTTITLEYTYNL